MLRRLRAHLTYANVMVTVLAFIVLGGTAYALQANSVKSKHIVNGQVKTPDIGASTAVPLGGTGRMSDPDTRQSCNTVIGNGYVNCAYVSLRLPARSRVLVSGRITGYRQTSTEGARGYCRIGTSAGPILDSEVSAYPYSGETSANVSLVAVTEPLPQGEYAFGVDCEEPARGDGAPQGDMYYFDGRVSAVALSSE